MRYGGATRGGRALISANAHAIQRIVGGRRLEIVRYDVRAADRATIVLLHEGLGSASAWRDFPKSLAERTGHDVVVYSRYGYGKSERLTESRDVTYMHDEGERVLPALLEELGIVRPILMGHSDGASIAIIFAGAHPHAVAGLILEAPHVFVEDVSVASIAKAKIAFETTDLASKLARHHDDAKTTFYGWNDVWLDPRFRTWNIEPYLEKIRAPVLVLQGSDDEYGTMAQVVAISVRARARSVMLDRCGHAPHRDQRERTLDEIVKFASALDASG